MKVFTVEGPMSDSSWITKSAAGQEAYLDNRMRIITVSEQDGAGRECAYCGKLIYHGTVARRVKAILPAGIRTLRFHRVCHHLWETGTGTAGYDRCGEAPHSTAGLT